jgi:aspartate oxidase
VIFAAGSTILAAGGLGRIYAHSDNPIDISGEAVGVAWRHGAELRDMEFIQFYPYRLVSPINIDLYTKLFGKGAIMRNGQGSRFLEEYPRKELETRDVVCYQMFKQGKVLLDLSQVTASDLEAITPRLHSLLTKGYQGELLMQPVEHYSIGGISIDADGRTTVKGLYACGECTGGVHGANRLGGGALTESLVFGARAGKAAAVELSKPSARTIANAQRAVVQSGAIKLPFETGTKERIADVRKRLQEIMWNKVGIERTESGLQQACDELAQMAEELRDYTPLFDMLQVARIVARSALERKESRGAHQMVDYPREMDEWRGNLVVTGETVTFRPLPSLHPSGGN